MKKVNATELRAIEGGATYVQSCAYCGKEFKQSYWLFVSYMVAVLGVKAKVSDHEINCASAQMGF